MKRTIYYGLAMLLVLATIGTVAAGPNYVDANNDGVCDLFVDEDGDGINDNCAGDGTGDAPRDGTGCKNGGGQHNQRSNR
ncbi:MAG: hypothetical protein ACT6FE_02120 [Methanosarcinaceae archaeon]